MSKQEVGGTRLVPGAVGPGIYQEHLKGMERGEVPDQDRPQQEFQVPPPPSASGVPHRPLPSTPGQGPADERTQPSQPQSPQPPAAPATVTPSNDGTQNR